MNYLTLLLIPFIISSNSVSTRGPGSTIHKVEPRELAKNSELLRLAQTYQGDWISESYINKMIESKSPFEAQKESYQNIFIDQRFIVNGYFGISIYNYGDTETPPISYFKKLNENEFLLSHLKFGEDLLGDTCKSDCNKLIFLNDNGKKTIRFKTKNGVSDFIQLEKKCDDSHLCELEQFANKILLSGTYILMDGERNVLSSNFTIGEDGISSGFKDLERLQIWTFFCEINGIFESDIVQVGERSADRLGYYQDMPENVFSIETINDEIYLCGLDLIPDEYRVEKKEIKFILKKK